MTRKAAVTATITLILVFLADVPRPGHHRPTDTGVALQIVLVFGTLALGAIAALTALIYRFRPTPDRALVYSWLALGVLLGDVSLLMLGYWMLALEEKYAHYVLAPALLIITGVALGPPLIARAFRRIRRRA